MIVITLLQTLLLISLPLTTHTELSEWNPLFEGVQDVDEAVDEVHDAEIIKAVQVSMQDWAKKKNHTSTRSKRSQNSVCYEELGCFEDSGPFGYLEMLPSPPKEINTRFLLYSTKSRGDIPLLDVPFGNISTAWRWADRAFSSSSPTKVIVHGFGSNCDHVWVYEMRSALMAVEECNVICVDWEAGAILPNYVRAAANTRLVGKQLAMLLEGLADNINLKFENVHLIGFSLGAHVAGFAGSQLKNISRITGLDPAGPLFEAQDPRARLDSTDAMFVDVIHSNGENLILGGLGSWQPMGHVDFYPNGGRMQTGCSNLFVGAFTDIIWSSAVEARSLCNHRRAYKFFTDSVSPKCHFPAFPCNSYDDFLAGNCFGCSNGDKRCGNMGYYADKSGGRGQLYLLTRDEEPFCAHQYHVTVENSKTNRSVVSYGRILLTLVGDSTLNETFPMTRKDDAELVVGGRLSRMLVPHPALGIPIKVQVEYQAYSGWISSGLNRWLIDKVLLSDSFGKTSSICKKGLVLTSGVPVTLPLYPGNCHHPKDNDNSTISLDEIENKINHQDSPVKTTFIPTQVVQIGDEIIKNPKLTIDSIIKENAKIASLKNGEINEKVLLKRNSHIKTDYKHSGEENSKTKPNVIPMGKHFRIESENKTSDPLLSILDATDILSLPWQPLLANSLDNSPNERESGRAFGSINTKFRTINLLTDAFEDASNISEIVEPILKAPATKNARSHDINVKKKEISEPILGSTTVRSVFLNNFTKNSQNRTNRAHKPEEIDPKNLFFNQSDWIPSFNLLLNENQTENFDEFDTSNKTSELNSTFNKNETYSIFQYESREKNDDDLNNNSFTVQFLPSRLVSFLEKAEKYARNTLLPLVSAYTPKFLFFGGDTDSKRQYYVPLDDTNNNSSPELSEKVDLIKQITPPSKPSTTTLTTTTTTTESSINNDINDPIKIVKPPVIPTTTLTPIMIKPNGISKEKIIIVYPSNGRNDRKIQSHSYSEIMQFENLYRQNLDESSRSNGVYVDLPTYEPPTTKSPFIYSTTPKFIPISYATEKPGN